MFMGIALVISYVQIAPGFYAEFFKQLGKRSLLTITMVPKGYGTIGLPYPVTAHYQYVLCVVSTSP